MSKGYIYIFDHCLMEPGTFKVGRAKNVKSRMQVFRTGVPEDFTCHFCYPSHEIEILEKNVHYELEHIRLDRREFFRPVNCSYRTALWVIMDRIMREEHGDDWVAELVKWDRVTRHMSIAELAMWRDTFQREYYEEGVEIYDNPLGGRMIANKLSVELLSEIIETRELK